LTSRQRRAKRGKGDFSGLINIIGKKEKKLEF
jgi:hypothetical protein